MDAFQGIEDAFKWLFWLAAIGFVTVFIIGISIIGYVGNWLLSLIF